MVRSPHRHPLSSTLTTSPWPLGHVSPHLSVSPNLVLRSWSRHRHSIPRNSKFSRRGFLAWQFSPGVSAIIGVTLRSVYPLPHPDPPRDRASDSNPPRRRHGHTSSFNHGLLLPGLALWRDLLRPRPKSQACASCCAETITTPVCISVRVVSHTVPRNLRSTRSLFHHPVKPRPKTPVRSVPGKMPSRL